jgi:hypothetical protein
MREPSKYKSGIVIAALGLVYVLRNTGFFCPVIFMLSDFKVLYTPQILFV